MISVIIPSYNEATSIRDTVQKVNAQLKGIKKEIIVVNDGSTDDTGEILKEIKDIDNIIVHIKNKGYGASIKSGIIESRYDWILIIDADGTYPSESIHEMIKYLDDYDMVVGARIGKNVNIPAVRKPAKWLINQFANYICGERIPDLNSGLRIFKKEIAIRFFTLFPEGFSFTTTITMACLTNNYKVKFVAIDYHKRKEESKSSIKPFRDFIGFLSLITRMSIYFRPSKIFVPAGIILLIAGSIKGFIDFFRDGYFGAGNVMIVIAGLQILFMGVLASLIIQRTKL